MFRITLVHCKEDEAFNTGEETFRIDYIQLKRKKKLSGLVHS
jgi:hypothetical protein